MKASVIVLSSCALLGGLASLLGWPLDIPRLTDWFNGPVSTQPNTALLIMSAAAGVIFVQLGASRTAMALGALVVACATVILLQYIVGADFGINQGLLFGRTWGQETLLTPGRVGPPASASLALVGTALVLLAHAQLQPARVGLRRLVRRSAWRCVPS